MELSHITVVILGITFGICQGLVFVGEDKRQGLIPFPRVGRTYTPWLPSSLLPTDIGDDTADNAYLNPEDVLTVRYARGLFAPRLGRRKRATTIDDASSDKTDSGNGRAAINGNGVLNFGDFLRRTPWAIIAYKDGVDKKMAFSPRLGRAMAPRLGRKRSDDSLSRDEVGDAEKRAAAFAPRLGRGYLNPNDMDTSDDVDTPFEVASRAAFSPRLGRSQSYVQTRAAAFAPRLGRSDPSNDNVQSQNPNEPQ